MDLTRFEPKKADLRDAYVGNECDTDEYGETQPVKGLGIIADLASRLEGHDDDLNALMALVRTWTTAWNGTRYGGAEELAPICALYFDTLWAAGEHPYESNEADLAERIADDVL